MKIRKTVKIVNIVLLVIASIAMLVCIPMARIAEEEAKYDGSKIKAEIVSTRTDVKESGSYGYKEYYVYTEFEIKNKAKNDVIYIEIVTLVYNKQGEKLGYLTSTFGSSSALESNLELGAGKTLKKECHFKTDDLEYEPLLNSMYNSNFGELEYKSEVAYVIYKDGRTWYSDTNW